MMNETERDLFLVNKRKTELLFLSELKVKLLIVSKLSIEWFFLNNSWTELLLKSELRTEWFFLNNLWTELLFKNELKTELLLMSELSWSYFFNFKQDIFFWSIEIINLDEKLIIMTKTEEREQDESIVFKIDVHEVIMKS